jgi:hypothetical protein
VDFAAYIVREETAARTRDPTAMATITSTRLIPDLERWCWVQDLGKKFI